MKEACEGKTSHGYDCPWNIIPANVPGFFQGENQSSSFSTVCKAPLGPSNNKSKNWIILYSKNELDSLSSKWKPLSLLAGWEPPPKALWCKEEWCKHTSGSGWWGRAPWRLSHKTRAAPGYRDSPEGASKMLHHVPPTSTANPRHESGSFPTHCGPSISCRQSTWHPRKWHRNIWVTTSTQYFPRHRWIFCNRSQLRNGTRGLSVFLIWQMTQDIPDSSPAHSQKCVSLKDCGRSSSFL